MIEDCWELWIYTTWKRRYFLYWLWISYKYMWIFLFVLCFCYCCCYYFSFLNNRSSCLAPEWFFVSSRETVGLWPENNNRNVFITRVTAGDDYCFFFVKRKCYRELNVLSNWFKGAFLENKILSLFYFSCLRFRFTLPQEGWRSALFLLWQEKLQSFSWFVSFRRLGRNQE